MGIETSCDETSIAFVKEGKVLLSNVVYSQIKEHQKFYGVVPEIASRSHLLKINEVYEKAIKSSKIQPEDISYVAVTNRPGLVGSLMIGGQFAKTFSLVYQKPIVTVDHVEAHFYANFLERQEEPTYPFLGLLLSGGNTAIYHVEGLGKLQTIANTQDDALGEALDKASSLLQLGYPGGPQIEKMAKKHQPQKNDEKLFPKILKDLHEEEITFSFSGIKTALLYLIQKQNSFSIPNICYDFQETCFELVIRMLKRAIIKTKIKRVEAGGGVLANEELRKKLHELSKEMDVQIYYPKNKLFCTDNGAMIATLGYYLFKEGKISDLDFNVYSHQLI